MSIYPVPDIMLNTGHALVIFLMINNPIELDTQNIYR